MKVEIKIPKGWRKLRRNEIIREGDMLNGVAQWLPSQNIGYKPSSSLVYIRKKH